MIDQEYFEKHFAEQRKGFKGSFTVRIHLHDGSSIELFQIQSIHAAYLLIQAYPLNGADPAMGEDTELANGPLLAVPYEAIKFVEQTKDVPKGNVGFKLP